MKSILSEIIQYKREEVTLRKRNTRIDDLIRKIPQAHGPVSLSEALQAEDTSGIIAEFKPKSPSAGVININARADEVTKGYVLAGASALSVLTDSYFFGSSFDNFILARQHNRCPILLKDFIIDEYQVFEARSLGADAILLIASALSCDEVIKMATLARSLGMECILEVHSADELDHLSPEISLVGINNRNLNSFNVELANCINIAEKIPGGYLKIAESGIENPEDVIRFRKAGFNGFLIGSHFMKNTDPAGECRKFISGLKSLDRVICL